MKRIVGILVGSVLAVSLCGCSISKDLSKLTDSAVKSTEDSDAPDRSEIMIDALQSKDKEAFKSVFSKQALKLSPDIDDGIDYVFDTLKGDITDIVYRNGSGRTYGSTKKEAWSIVVFKTTESCYMLRWTEWTKQTDDPDVEGVYSLVLSECDEDQKGAGGGRLLAGIEHPGRAAETKTLDDFFNGMHNNDFEILSAVFSDSFLSDDKRTEELKGFMGKYTTTYETLVAAWRINDTVCVQLPAPKVFICLTYDSEQTDKISSVRVFDSTKETEDTVSAYDFSSDSMGIFY